MMTFIAFAGVATAAFLAGGISCVAFAAWLESNAGDIIEKNAPQADDLMKIADTLI